MKKFKCHLVCDGGYWFVELPFNAGTIDLGSSLDELKDMSDELKVIDFIETGMSDNEIIDEYLLEKHQLKRIRKRIEEYSK